jgi:hypothetical protein
MDATDRRADGLAWTLALRPFGRRVQRSHRRVELAAMSPRPEPPEGDTHCRRAGAFDRRTAAVLLLVGVGLQAGQAHAQASALEPVSFVGPTLADTALLERVAPSDALPAAPRLTFEHTRLPAGALSSVVALDAAGRPLADAAGFTYRWWLRRGRADVGVGLGALGRVVAPVEVHGGPTLAYAASTLTLGLRYHLTERSTLYADASGARSAQGEAGADLFAAKLGVEWAGHSRSRLGFDKGAFGLLLDSGYRMSLRVRHGGLGIYVRGQF